MAKMAQANQVVCSYFPQGCRNGANCRFVHVLIDEVERKRLDNLKSNVKPLTVKRKNQKDQKDLKDLKDPKDPKGPLGPEGQSVVLNDDKPLKLCSQCLGHKITLLETEYVDCSYGAHEWYKFKACSKCSPNFDVSYINENQPDNVDDYQRDPKYTEKFTDRG